VPEAGADEPRKTVQDDARENHLRQLYVPVSQGGERTASGPAGEIGPVRSVVNSRITRESLAERPLTRSG
jgi:hypothetical protein